MREAAAPVLRGKILIDDSSWWGMRHGKGSACDGGVRYQFGQMIWPGQNDVDAMGCL
jgi:hypothetical protein